MKARLLVVCGVGLVLLTISLPSTGQKCNAEVTPDPNPILGYQFRSNRCEGTLNISIAAPRMALVSFTKGKLNYVFGKPTVIKLTPLNPGVDTIHVRAIPFQLAVPYRMDASLAARDTLAWSTGDVIERIGLIAGNLGIFGWTGPEDTKTFVPVDLMQANSTLRIVLRASTDLQSVRWRVAKKGQGQLEPFGNYVSLTGSFNPHDPIEVKIEQTPRGNYLLEVVSTRIGAPTHVAQFNIQIP